ncbi:MAG TPA: PadR family transcriptional regulator [Candidatus Dormibacteraeota bacterium]|nr:PadR family transcriptional regulator [Candidatus Dormibacteraeota bacterium]
MSTNRARLPRTPLTLAVLNLLSERAMHPYEMKTLMRERGHDAVIKLKGGSVYDTVERLQRLGFIDTVETSREGRRPERTVYAINEAGRDELKAWLRDMVARPVNDYPQFAAALAFVVGLEDCQEVISELTRRAVALEAQIAADDTMLRSMAETGIPRIFGIELEYARAMRRAEMEWVRGLIQELKEGDLWPDIEALKTWALAEAQEARPKEVSD